jgi:clan AA aspartic protease (TIGR02281 family)
MSDGDGAPSGTMLRRAVMLLIGCSAAAFGLPGLVGTMDGGPGDSAAPSTPPPPRPRVDGIPVAEPPATETYHASRGNQFYLTGSVNGYSIRFLVDTGATYVSLTPEDATRLGFDLTKLHWNLPMRTANGISRNAQVTLGDVRLNRIVAYNVPAIIMSQNGISLLGMSFLSRLRSWQISNGVLTIAS